MMRAVMPLEPVPARRTVLIVDDSVDNRELYAEYLRFHRFSVTEAASGHEALAQALADPPDVAVIDITMPGVDGLSVVKALKADDRTRDTLMFVVTAEVFGDIRQRVLDAGADLYLSKPCPPEELLAAIRTYRRPG